MAVDTSTVQVVMPAMGDSVSEGTVLEWHKQEGDTVAADETLVEISTDKVDAEVPAPVAGTVIKIHAGEGDTVAVGAVARRDRRLRWGTRRRRGLRRRRPRRSPRARPTGCRSRRIGAEPQDAAEPEPAALQSAGATIDIVTPTGGESVTEGTILEWAVKVGDQVKNGDTVVEISTDKVDMELPAPTSGTITEILAHEGETVTVGQVIGRMTAGASDGRGRPRPRVGRARRRHRRHGDRTPTPASGRLRPRRPPPPARRRPPMPPRSLAGSPQRRASTSTRSPAPRAAAGSPSQTCSSAGNGAAAAPPAQAPGGAELIKGAVPRSLATWSRAARSRPRPRSARSPSRRSTSVASSSRTPAAGSRSRT